MPIVIQLLFYVSIPLLFAVLWKKEISFFQLGIFYLILFAVLGTPLEIIPAISRGDVPNFLMLLLVGCAMYWLTHFIFFIRESNPEKPRTALVFIAASLFTVACTVMLYENANGSIYRQELYNRVSEAFNDGVEHGKDIGITGDERDDAYYSGYENGKDEGRDEAFDDGYDEGYREGERDGFEEGLSSAYYEYMDIYDILENRSVLQDIYKIYIYGFKKGYNDAVYGIWDEETEEYVNGYDIETLDGYFSRYFP